MTALECRHTDLAVAPGRPAVTRTASEALVALERAQDADLALVATLQRRAMETAAEMRRDYHDAAALDRMQDGLLTLKRNCRAVRAGVVERGSRIAVLRGRL